MAAGNELIKQARSIINNKYGFAFNAKATDEAALSIAFPPQAEDFIPQQNKLILEFSSKDSSQEILPQVYKSQSWEKIKNVISEVNAENTDFRINIEQLLRQERITYIRDQRLKKINLITSQIEASLSRLYATRSKSLIDAGPLTRTCWLNYTARSLNEPLSIAEIASDAGVYSIDTPRPLTAEINTTGPLLFADKYRQHFFRSGKGIIVAVIDSEAAINHPALTGRVIQRGNYTNEPWGTPDKHGTAVAGIIAANDPNNVFVGMAPGATIYNYKVLATNRFLNSTDFEGSLAIQQAVEDGVRIANCSWGSGLAGDGSSREAQACNVAWSLGLTIIKSAGNNGPDANGSLTSPSDAEGVIVVGATDKAGTAVQFYSSRGLLEVGPRPHLVAPGGTIEVDISSCLLSGNFGSCGIGTSFAAPHITGLLALLLEGDPNLTPDEQRDLLIKLCRPLPGIPAIDQGAGMPILDPSNPLLV